MIQELDHVDENGEIESRRRLADRVKVRLAQRDEEHNLVCECVSVLSA